MNMAGMRVADVHSSGEILHLITNQRALNFEPGTAHLYSNTGYFLISVVTERVTGKTFREYADEKIFGPLGMRHTLFDDDRTMIVRGRVMAYSPDGDSGYRQNYWANFEKVGSGGLLSSVEDLFHWDQNFYRNRLSPADLMETLHTSGVLNTGDTLDYAFGLQLSEYRGLRTVRHGGSSMGFRAHLLRSPDQSFSTTILCNVSTANPAELAERVAEIYLADHLREPQSVAAGPRAAEPGGGPAPALSPARLEEYVGEYHADELRVDYELALEGDRLILRRPAAARAVLRPTAPDTFRTGSWTIHFTRGPEGRVTGFAVDAGRVRNLDFVRR
jgi:CubicO group peptidase (beta-lactamase class C family)